MSRCWSTCTSSRLALENLQARYNRKSIRLFFENDIQSQFLQVAMLLASRSQQDALPHMKTLNSASGSQLAFNNILMLSFHYFLLQVQAWVLILVSGLHGLFSSLQVPWRAKLLIHLILETLLFKYIHQPFLWTWATTWLHIFCQVPSTLGGKFFKKRSLSEIFVYLSGAVVKGHPTATGSEVALHPGEPRQESNFEEPWWACWG